MADIEIKGTGLISTRTYVQERHPERYKEWHNSLPDEIRSFYKGFIDSSEWYSIERFYLIPLKNIAELFYGGNEKKAAIEVGRFSADFALNGVYKAFLINANPESLVNSAERVFMMYHRPVDIEIEKIANNKIRITATRLYHKGEIIDYGMIGWCSQALELANCKNVRFKPITCPELLKHSVEFSWE